MFDYSRRSDKDQKVRNKNRSKWFLSEHESKCDPNPINSQLN